MSCFRNTRDILMTGMHSTHTVEWRRCCSLVDSLKTCRLYTRVYENAFLARFRLCFFSGQRGRALAPSETTIQNNVVFLFRPVIKTLRLVSILSYRGLLLISICIFLLISCALLLYPRFFGKSVQKHCSVYIVTSIVELLQVSVMSRTFSPEKYGIGPRLRKQNRI